MNPPRLTEPPKVASISQSTMSLLPAATAQSITAAVVLARRVAAVRRRAITAPLTRRTTSRVTLSRSAVSSESEKLSLMTVGRYSMARLRITT